MNLPTKTLVASVALIGVVAILGLIGCFLAFVLSRFG